MSLRPFSSLTECVSTAEESLARLREIRDDIEIAWPILPSGFARGDRECQGLVGRKNSGYSDSLPGVAVVQPDRSLYFAVDMVALLA